MENQVDPGLAPVRWGVLSTARIALNSVIPAIRNSESAQLMALGSRDPARARELLRNESDLRIYESYEELLNDTEIEAIYNPLPNGLHAEWTIKALHAGKHVLCEKPLAVTAAEGRRMIEAARESERFLMEAFMYRFHPQTIWALEQINSGRLGEVRLVRASFSFPIFLTSGSNDVRLQPQLAGGSLMDIGCYPINFCRAVYGRPPVAVAARVYPNEAGSVEQSTSAVLDFGAGRQAVIDCSFLLPQSQVVEVLGEKGSLTLPRPFSPDAQSGSEVVLSLEDQTIRQRISPVNSYIMEIEHFGACVRSGTSPAFSLEESLENIATLEAIYQSAGHKWPLNS